MTLKENFVFGATHGSRFTGAGAPVLFVWLLVLTCLLLNVQRVTAETQISVEYSFPEIYEHDPPADHTLEGSRTATITCDEAIRPVSNPQWLTRISDLEYSVLFLWNETTDRLVQFTDVASDTIDILLQLEPNLPLNLANHDGPVFHIQTAPENLWDQDTGIYVWGNHYNHQQTGEEWERPAVVQYYDDTGTRIFTESIGLRINGQSSRNYNQKGLRLYFDDYGTSDTIECDFFGHGPTTFERLVLRGNRYPDFAISSGVNEPLHQDLGHKGSRHSSVAVYLNNEFWGAYSLRERLDDEYVEKTWQWADDDDFILIKDHEAEVGDYSVWENFLAGFSDDAPFDSHSWYEEISSQIDLVAYIDWLMINVCGATSDNMAGKNLAILKLDNGPWEYMTWDEDILYQSSNLNANHLRFYSAGNTAEYLEYQPPVWFSGGPWAFTWQWNNMLRALMQNAEFKSLLRHRGAELLAGPLSSEGITARIDSLSVHQRPEWVNHGLRWRCSSLWYPYKRDVVKTFVTNRHPIVVNHLAEFLEYWAQPVELVSFSISEFEGQMELNWTTEREDGCAGFLVQRSTGADGNYETIASWDNDANLVATGEVGQAASYSFSDIHGVQNEDLWYRLAWESDLNTVSIIPWVETNYVLPVFDLRLNEFMALNYTTIMDEFGEFDDWAEIYNSGDEAVNTGGLFLSDDLGFPTKWALPDTVIGAHEFLLVWCDSDLEQGPLHAGFKLAGAGEELGLYSSISTGNLPIDTIVFDAQQTDISWGRQTDGEGLWGPLLNPSPGAANLSLTAASGSPNAGVSFLSARPNPFNPSTSISFELFSGSEVKLQVFDIRGRLVSTLCQEYFEAGSHDLQWNGLSNSGRKSASGLYFAVISAQQQKRTIKLVLLN